MEALRERLDELRTHLQDQKWLAAHADSLFSTLDSALNSPPQVNDAIECLIAVCPYMFTRSDFRRWSSLLFDALLNAQLLQDNELQMRVWEQLGEGYYLAGQHQEAHNAFVTALERARDGRTKEMMLAAYIGIIRLQSLRLDGSFNPEFVQETLALAQQVDDLPLHGRLHRVIASAHAHRGETETALGHSQLALVIWHRLKDTLEMARAAFVIATVYRAAELPRNAEQFLELAERLFTQVDYTPSYCLMAYQEGTMYLLNQEHETARQWLNLALLEAGKIDNSYYCAMCYHSLAIAQIELGQFSEAEENLRTALAEWEKFGNWFYQANGYQALGYLESCRGDVTKARHWLKVALQICPYIPDTPFRIMLEQLIAETLAELE